MALTPDQMDAVVRRTVALYDDAERLLLGRIAKSLAEGLDAPDWAAKKLLEVQMVQVRLRRDLNLLAGKAAAEISTGIGEAYNAGQITAVGQLGRVVDGGSPVNPFVSQAAVALARDTVAGITGQHARVLRSVGDVYRNVIAEVVGVQLAGATNQRELAGRALAKFADKGVTGFVDSAGRRWSMSAYTEMAMRTATHNASEVGHTERLQAEGHDLVIVSDHAQECPDCARWEGKVLSLSGTYEKGHPQKQRDGGVRVMIAGTLAQAKQDGYGHPGCRHRVVAFFPGVTKLPERQGDPGDYLLRQEQRHLERGVKRWRRREAAALTPAEAKLARAKAREWGERLRAHEATHGLKRQPWRTSAGGTRQLPPLPDYVARPAARPAAKRAAKPTTGRKTFGKITPGLRASTYDQPMETFKWVGYSDEWVERARSTLRAMDSIGVLPEGVDFLGDETGRRRNGAYVTGTEQVLLAKSANGNTIAHEVGHLIDCLFFSGRGYSSRNRTTKAWRDWHDTISETAKMKQIAEAGRTGRISKEWAAYASQDIEMWARSFAQWVAVRSEDPELLAEIRKAQKGEGPGGSIYMVWSDEDFAPLLPLIDKLMGSVSLAKPAGYAGGGG